MKFLLDQGLPRSAVGFLRELGFHSEHVGAIGLTTAEDETILEAGRVRGEIVVTLDADFHSILARSNATSPSVVRIRIEGIKGDHLARIIVRVVDLVGKDLAAGAAITVSERRLALRRLPIMSPDRKRAEPSN